MLLYLPQKPVVEKLMELVAIDDTRSLWRLSRRLFTAFSGEKSLRTAIEAHKMNLSWISACMCGKLDVILYLHENNIPMMSTPCYLRTAAMDIAATHGHLEAVKWLHENRSEGCTHLAMDNAARNGHLDVLQWLHANRTEGCTIFAVNWAARNGHLAVVQWLHVNRTKDCSTTAIYDAIKYGHLEVVHYLLSNSRWTEISIERALYFAGLIGNQDILQCILDYRRKQNR